MSRTDACATIAAAATADARIIARTRRRGSPFPEIVLPLLCLSFLTGCPTSTMTRSASQPAGTDIVTVREDFDLETPGDAWSFRTPSLWRIAVENDRRFLQMAVPPERPMLPGVRRPQEYAIYTRYAFRSFALSCRVRIDRDTSVKARDAVIIFGRQDETHFYYVHLSSLSDAAHNTLMRVDGETRTPIVQGVPPAIADAAWHKVDVLRNADTGSIQIYVDAHDPADATPLFSAVDKTYEWGHIGFGSFDDHASFTRIIIEGEARR